jgi:hypothetical protein
VKVIAMRRNGIAPYIFVILNPMGEHIGNNMKIWLIDSLRQAAWAPLSVFVFYATAAKVLNAYILYPTLDIPTHFCGGLAITYFFHICIVRSQILLGSIPTLIQSLLAIGLTALTAVVWEFWEYASDITLGTQMNLGVADTLSDLFFGLLGAMVMLTVVWAKRSVPTRAT